jgi:aminobenzoyl-glutamate utilization protein A
MNSKILALAQGQKEEIINRRRDFHKFAEVGWTEFRTASIVADTLLGLGFQVLIGDEVIHTEAMMGVPSSQELAKQEARALSQGANTEWVAKMHGGRTGVVGVMNFSQPGPTVAFRFDMDANDVVEEKKEGHRPWKEGFSSINHGAMHACGHDGHAAVGLALAKVIVNLKDILKGRVKLIFQPAEEGVRGAKAMAASGLVDDVDYLIGMHLGFALKKNKTVTCQATGFLATTKIDAVFTGVPAHAGAAPEAGRNALLAVATAAVNLHAVSRHSKGTSRINVGYMQAGTGRNIVPANAVIKLETRGANNEINEYMYNAAIRILKAAAAMYDVTVEMIQMGSAVGCENDSELVKKLQQVAINSNLFEEILPSVNLGGSEDCTHFMERVQQKGGQAAYLVVGTELMAGHHDSHFDFNEDTLVSATAFLGEIAAELLR